MLFEKIKLEDDEQVLLIVRRHWFVFLTRILSVIVAGLAPFLILWVATLQTQTSGLVSNVLLNYSDQVWFLGALWLLFNWMTLAHIWTDHYLDLWVVTDRRIVSIDQKSLFVRSIASFRLERLQDMNIEIPGFMATMLNYGNIDAQTAGHGESDFKVIGMPNPREIKALILEAADTRMKQENMEARKMQTEGL